MVVKKGPAAVARGTHPHHQRPEVRGVFAVRVLSLWAVRGKPTGLIHVNLTPYELK